MQNDELCRLQHERDAAQAERAQAQAALELSERRLRTLIDGIPDRAWLKDAQGRFLALNQGTACSMGVPMPQALGKTIAELIPGDAARIIAEEDRLAMLAPGPTRIETQPAFGEGWLEMIRTPIRNAGGQVEGLVFVSRNVTERKRGEQALHASEARFRKFAELSADWYWETDAQGRFTLMTRTQGAEHPLNSNATLGFTLDDVIRRLGARCEQLVPAPAEHARLLAEHASVREGLARWTFADGSVRYLNFSTEPMVDADGAFLGWRGATRDVTQIGQARRALELAKQRFDLALGASNTFVFDLDLVTQTATLHGAQRFGGPGSLGQVSFDEMLTTVHPEDAAALREFAAQVRSGARDSVDLDYRLRRPDGGQLWRHLNCRVTRRDTTTGRALQVGGTSVDIDARKRADLALLEREAKLRRSELRYRLAAASGKVWEWDPASGRFNAPLEVWTQLGLEVPPPETALARFAELMHPEDLPHWRHVVREHLARRAPYQLEFRARTANGQWRWFHTEGQAVWDDAGRPTYMAGTAFDITARKTAEAALRESEGALRAHESQLIELTQRLMRQEQATAERIAQTLHDRLGQTLAVARLHLEAGLADPTAALSDAARITGVHVATLLGQATQDMRRLLVALRPPLLEERGLAAALDTEIGSLRLPVGAADVLLEADASLFEQRWPAQVEYNAFMVAREAIANAALHARASLIRVLLDGDAGALALEIADDGVGVAAAQARGRPGHLGIVGMRERAAAIGAEFGIGAGSAAGTRVTLRWRTGSA
jgi:PAS domain S-box-containing protein